jgi:rhamnosyltransferase subunit B
MTPDTGKKVVLATRGTFGDVIPFVGIGKQLKALGHHVVICSAREYEALVREHGLDWAPMAPHFDQYIKDLGMDKAAILRKAFRPLIGGKFVADKLVKPYLNQAFEELGQALEGADLLVSGPTVTWARIIAHEKRVPWRSVMLQPLPLTAYSAQDPVYFPKLPLRQAIKLLGEARYRRVYAWARRVARPFVKPLDDRARQAGCYDPDVHPLFEGTFSPRGTIVLSPVQMMRNPPPTDLPGPVKYAGFSFFDGGTKPLSPELEAFLAQGEPPVVFSLGSGAVGNAVKFYETWSRMCTQLGLRALFLSADHDLGRSFPPTQMLVPWVSVSALFPRCKAVISAGGIGMCGHVVRAGVPQIIVPFNFDQPDNAMRLQRLGTCIPVLPGKALGPEMAAALQRLVTDPELHRRAKALKAEINQDCGTLTAARWLDADVRGLPET